VVIHGLWFLYYRLVLGGKFIGPNSVVPTFKDLKDFRLNMAYFFGRKSSPPAFDKFTYMEKIDYWAIFIGMNTMGATGLFLWFPEFFTRFLPGFFVNIALILHFFEAVLAVVIKFFIHIGMAHFRPAVYPADMSIFTGRTTGEQIMEEHPGQWRSMAESGDTAGKR
jgi:cytochrome b subunit of formate dehydrogenase